MSKPSASLKVLYGEQSEQVLAIQAESLKKRGLACKRRSAGKPFRRR